MNRPSHAFLLTLAVLLALLHAVLAVTATTGKSMTSDEIAHLVAGHAYNRRGDFRLQPENGNLPQRLAGLPMSVAGVPLPPPTLESWRTADVWNYGHTTFYRQGIAADQWLFLGRGMIALVSAATALIVFFWSRALFGWRGGFLSLALFVFCPAFLAHGALATSDVVMTFCFVASLGAWWRHLQTPGWRWATLSALALGVAFVAKFSAVLLPPMLALTGLGWAAGEAGRTGWRAPLLRLLRSTAFHAATTWAVIWLFYGFRFSAFAPALAEGATFNHGWGWMLHGIGLPAKAIWWLQQWRVLPEAWLYGLTFVLQFSRARGAFMSGDYSVTGWVMFFPFAFLVKTTLPFLLLLAGGAGAAGVTAIRIRTRDGLGAVARRLQPLAALFVIYWITSLASHLNIGHRHILPTYPVLFIAAGWLGRGLDPRRPLVLAGITALTLWHAGESLRARPHYLAYFNPIVGGSGNGWRHLVDSSLDWGQDLPGLKRWLDAHARGEAVFLSYFGTGDPAYEGIRATMLPTLPEVGTPRRWHALTPGVYAIGATMLQHVYSSIRGDWTLELEREFQQLRATEPALLAYQNDAARRAELLRDAPAGNWTTAWKRYELLRFARLCHYLRVRAPEGVVGHSIRIYRLTAEELRGAVGGSPAEWRELIERAVRASR
jgi:4-amino-4-deoxy-L-arabinose transferase-like glycosyltransferase